MMALVCSSLCACYGKMNTTGTTRWTAQQHYQTVMAEHPGVFETYYERYQRAGSCISRSSASVPFVSHFHRLSDEEPHGGGSEHTCVPWTGCSYAAFLFYPAFGALSGFGGGFDHVCHIGCFDVEKEPGADSIFCAAFPGGPYGVKPAGIWDGQVAFPVSVVWMDGGAVKFIFCLPFLETILLLALGFTACGEKTEILSGKQVGK